MASNPKPLVLNALRVEQRKDAPIFVFGIDGRLVHQLATVSYAERSKDGVLSGYQRGAVQRHIADIVTYLSEANSMLPNAIVIAFDDRVKFEPLKEFQRSEWGTFGRLEIPLPRNASEEKVGWIVDGQQRATALAQLKPGRPLPVVVVAFQSSSQDTQREQFLLVNKTKPLPRDLLHEILPGVRGVLSKDLEKRRLASRVLQYLRFDSESPFYNRVRGIGTKTDGANISQAAILAVVQDSIRKKGVLFDHFGSPGQKHDEKAMARTVSVFFEGVRRTWPKAWDSSPKESRLVHGVGIVALGHLMDRVMHEVDATSPRAASSVQKRLECLKDRCAWTSGKWPVLGCGWNELQNTSQDKARLTEFVLKEYAKR